MDIVGPLPKTSEGNSY